MRGALLLVLVGAAVAWPIPARADLVTLANGDRVSGAVKDLTKGKLRIKTDHSGSLEVAWKSVAGVETEAEVEVVTVDDVVHAGRLAPAPEAGTLLVVPAGGGASVSLPLATVRGLRMAAGTWGGFADVGFRGTSGNTDTVGAIVQGEAVRTTVVNEALLRGIFRYGETDDGVSERNWYLLGRYRHDLAGALFAYGSTEFLQDAFKDIVLNTVLSAGLGYAIVRSDTFDLSAEAGAAYVFNDFDSAPDEDHVGARLAADARLSLPFGLELTDAVVFVPNFEEGDDWQLRNDLALAGAVVAAWKARLGLITEYYNEPAGDREETDQTYYLAMGYEF